jgi:hypothetical protein
MKKVIAFSSIPKSKRNGAALLALSLAVAAIAQYTLYLSYSGDPAYWNVSEWFLMVGNNTTPIPGLTLYALAGLLLTLSLRSLGETLPPLGELWRGTRPVLPPRFGFWLTAAGLALLTVIYTIRPQAAQSNGYALALTWIFSLALFSYSVLRQTGWQPLRLHDIRVWLNQNRLESAAVALLLILTIALRIYDLEIHPYSMVNDEGEMGKGALCLLRGECRNIFAIGWASQPYVAYLPYALTVGLLGNDYALPIRLVSVTTGTLAVLFTYLFSREAFDKRIALVAGVVLATLPYHIHFSRLGVDNIVDSLSSALILWLMIRSLRTGSSGYYLLAGIVSGLCLYTYPGSRLAPALGLLAFGFAALTQRGLLRAQWHNLVLLLAAALLTIAPLLGTYQSNPEFNQRINSVGLLQGNRLQEEMEYTGLNAAQVLVAQFFKSSLPFIISEGAFNFFSSPRAYFTPLASVFLMLGLAVAVWKLRDLRLLVLLAWFFAPIVFGSTLTVGPPSHQRMLGSAPAAAILVALGLVTVAQALGGLNQLLRRLAPLFLLVVLLFTGYRDIVFYFDEYRSSHLFEDLSNEITYESRTLIRSLEGQGRLLLIGAPMTRIFFGNFDYFNPDVEKYDFNEITPEAMASLPTDKDVLFLAIPDRESDLQRIAEWLPGGTWIIERRRNQPEYPLYFAYKVSKEQLQSYQP